MAKMSDFSNHNIFAYMLASCANLNFHPVSVIITFRDLSNFVLFISMKNELKIWHLFQQYFQ